MLAYRILRWFLRLSVMAFFRRIEVVGAENVPEDGPVLLCGNHPNSLLDPVLFLCFSGRVVRFAAKDTLFRMLWLRPFLAIGQAIPVMRRQDHPDATISNEDAFEKMFAALGRGAAVGIFPEGISHDESRLARLKTGAARIALGAARRHPSHRVRVVPCGLHYVTRQRFRSSVLIQFGAPIEVDADRLAVEREDPPAAVRELTDELESRLLSLTVNADDWETVRVLDGVRRLYQPPRIRLEERIELARRFNTHYPAVRDQPEVRRIVQRVRAYLDRLEAEGLSDRDLQRRIGTGEAALRFLRHLVLVGVWLPLALLGAPIHLPVGLVLSFAGRLAASEREVIATAKFCVGFVLLGAAYIAIPSLLWWRAGGAWALAAWILLPLSGFATLRVLARWAALRRMVITGIRLLRLRRELENLRAERGELERDIVVAVNRFRPEGLELMFPREPGVARDD